MKNMVLLLVLLFLLRGQGVAQQHNTNTLQKNQEMDRTEKAAKKYQELFAEPIKPSKTDPELFSILQKFIFGEVFYIGELDNKTRELITITILTTNQTLPQLRAHAAAALNTGVTPVEIREAVYQTAPFIGFPRVLNAVETINGVFESRGIKLPLENRGNVPEEQRFERGKEIQYPLYGNKMVENMKDLPGEYSNIIPQILTESCFGDFYTRSGLDLKTRELLILCCLVALGDTERQMQSHVEANITVGNTKEILIAAMIQCYPYTGFPRISNALNIIKGY